MKKKFSLGEGGIKGFFARHIEKMAFAAVVALSAFLISSGMKDRSKVPSGKSPDDLDSQVVSARQKIESFRWDTDYKKERDLQTKFLPRAKETLQGLDVALYEPKQMIKPPYVPPRTRRTDPKLFPAEDLVVRSGYGAMPIPQDPNDRRPIAPRKQRTLQDIPEKEQEDYRQIPQTYSSGGNQGGGRGGFGGSGELQGVYFVSVTGLIPYRKQVEEFNRCLMNSNYLPSRDVPDYFYWFLERADVTSDPSTPNDKLQWKKVAFLKKALDLQLLWGGGYSDNGNPMYELPGITMQVPPITGQDLEPWERHPKIPRIDPTQMNGTDGQVPGKDEEDPDALFGQDTLTASGSPMGIGGGMREEMGMRGGMRGEMEMGGGMGMGMGMGGAMMIDPTDPSTLPEYKMFRYFEVSNPRDKDTIRPGRAYRYRLRLWIIDPNDPRDPSVAPGESTLDRTVIDRIQNKPPSPSKAVPRIFWRETDWCEPSPVVHVSTGRELLCGKVTVPSATKLSDGREFMKSGSEPVVKVMAMVFDPVRAASTPGEFEAKRGSIGYFTGEIWEPLPEDGLLHRVKDYQFKIDNTVLDIQGGKDLLETVGLLTSPSQILVMDSVGRLSVRTEADDMIDYQRHNFKEVEDETEGGEIPGRERGRGGDDFRGFGGEMEMEF